MVGVDRASHLGCRPILRENVELVREGYRRFRRGDHRGTLELAHQEISWDTTGAMPDGSVYHGHAEVGAHWEDLFDRWEKFEVAPDEFVEVDDDTVLTAGTLRAKAKRSEAEVTSPWFVVWTVRDGKIWRLQNFLDRERAEEAAGLRG